MADARSAVMRWVLIRRVKNGGGSSKEGEAEFPRRALMAQDSGPAPPGRRKKYLSPAQA